MESILNINQLQQLSGAEVLQRLGRDAPRWVGLALVVVIGWQLSTVVWALIPGSSDPAGTQAGANAPAAQSAGGAARPAVSISAITNAHLFGVADASAPVARETQKDLADTTLNLKLKGTIAASEPKFALAIIADNANREKVYAVDDTVASGTTLHAVEKDRVILSRSGRLEALKLPQEFSKSSRPATRKRNSRVSTAGANRQAASASVRDAITKNVSSLTDVIRPQPYFSGGQQKGYRVYPGKDRKQFSALGLRPGDLVTEINGTAMTDPRQGMEVFRSLGDASSVSVTVERNGQPQTLTLSTEQLNSQD